jgi:uncharacterized protein
MENAESMSVEVAYALPDKQVILTVQLAPGATLREAIDASGLLDRFPDIDLASQKVGIFGKLKKFDQTLHPGDRVEIYRHLIADPKEVRKKRAAEGKRMKKGGGDREDGEAAE